MPCCRTRAQTTPEGNRLTLRYHDSIRAYMNVNAISINSLIRWGDLIHTGVNLIVSMVVGGVWLWGCGMNIAYDFTYGYVAQW